MTKDIVSPQAPLSYVRGSVRSGADRRRARWQVAVLCVLAPALFAGQTRTWSQGEFADFAKGIVKNLSLRSDGQLTLAPVSRELFDTSSAYLWALAQDSKGNLYAGGGNGAKLYRIPPDGQGKLLADLEALEIHAIAVDSKDRVYADKLSKFIHFLEPDLGGSFVGAGDGHVGPTGPGLAPGIQDDAPAPS